MDYEQVQKLSDEKFRRLTGVKRETFLMMVEILKNEYEKQKQNHKYSLNSPNFNHCHK